MGTKQIQEELGWLSTIEHDDDQRIEEIRVNYTTREEKRK